MNWGVGGMEGGGLRPKTKKIQHAPTFSSLRNITLNTNTEGTGGASPRLGAQKIQGSDLLALGLFTQLLLSQTIFTYQLLIPISHLSLSGSHNTWATGYWSAQPEDGWEGLYSAPLLSRPVRTRTKSCSALVTTQRRAWLLVAAHAFGLRLQGAYNLDQKRKRMMGGKLHRETGHQLLIFISYIQKKQKAVCPQECQNTELVLPSGLSFGGEKYKTQTKDLDCFIMVKNRPYLLLVLICHRQHTSIEQQVFKKDQSKSTSYNTVCTFVAKQKQTFNNPHSL